MYEMIEETRESLLSNKDLAHRIFVFKYWKTFSNSVLHVTPEGTVIGPGVRFGST